MLTRQQSINILFWAEEWYNYISDTIYNTYTNCMYYINSNMEDCVEDYKNINDEYQYSDAYIPGPYDDIKNYHDYDYDGGYGYVYGPHCSCGYGYDN
jgi:hypothetical protein